MAVTRGRGGRTSWLKALVVLSTLMVYPGCVGEEPEMQSAPLGAIKELESDSSITTDVNARSPAFARESSLGTVIKTQDYIGRQVLLLDFWSVFCQSCLQELPFLQELYQRYHDDGLEILSINTDFFPLSRIVKFMEKTGIDLPYPLVHDRDQSLSRLFGVDALPVTILIDSSGWIRMAHLGYRPGDRKMIESRVKKAIGKIRETVVTLQPVEGRTAFAPPGKGQDLLSAGSFVPDFKASTEGGSMVSFSSLRSDSPAVLFFWSLFCQPCREEFPHLQSMAKKYGPQGLWTAAVNIDTGKLRPAVSRFLSRKGGGLTALYDLSPEGERAGVAEAFGVHYTPSTFLIAADGSVHHTFSGEVSSEELDMRIEELVRSKGEKQSKAPPPAP